MSIQHNQLTQTPNSKPTGTDTHKQQQPPPQGISPIPGPAFTLHRIVPPRSEGTRTYCNPTPHPSLPTHWGWQRTISPTPSLTRVCQVRDQADIVLWLLKTSTFRSLTLGTPVIRASTTGKKWRPRLLASTEEENQGVPGRHCPITSCHATRTLQEQPAPRSSLFHTDHGPLKKITPYWAKPAESVAQQESPLVSRAQDTATRQPCSSPLRGRARSSGQQTEEDYSSHAGKATETQGKAVAKQHAGWVPLDW